VHETTSIIVLSVFSDIVLFYIFKPLLFR